MEWNSFTSCTAEPARPSAAADILSARRRSTGYMSVAVDSAPAVMGGSSLKSAIGKKRDVRGGVGQFSKFWFVKKCMKIKL